VSGAGGIQQGPVQFMPANSIKEAEKWAKKNIVQKEANYYGMSVDVANDVNKTIFNLQEQGMPKLYRIESKLIRENGTVAQVSQNGNLQLNRKYLKTKLELAKLEARVEKQRQELSDTVKDLEGMIKQGKELPEDLQKLLKAAKENLKHKHQFSVNGVPGIINHEMGHQLWYQGYKIEGKGFQEWRDIVRGATKQAREAKYKYNISAYASEAGRAVYTETFAEAFALYQHGDIAGLPPKLLNLFEKYF